MGARQVRQAAYRRLRLRQKVEKGMSRPQVGAHLIFGANPEPFLEAALRSVDWVDYVCAVNTAPDDGKAAANEAVVRRTVPREKLRLERLRMGQMDFSRARNTCLSLATIGDYVLILDSDDVHYPEWRDIARGMIADGCDIITAHFWHLIGYKDLWGQEPHREILFTRTEDTLFEKGVHEKLVHPRETPGLAGTYHYVHYGYIKPPREIFRRWVLYSQLEGDPDHYAGRNPDDALAGWLDNTHPFWREHPAAVRPVLQSYPSAPRSARALPEGVPRNIGLVLLTWNDAENLGLCLKSLATTRQPFELMVVDNGSTDDTIDLIHDYMSEHPHVDLKVVPNQSLAQALNYGFRYFLGEHTDKVGNRVHDVDYIGWIHPDMVFERDTWLECLRHCLDTHPDIVKVGAAEMDSVISKEPWPGNSQCYLIRKTALAQTGLFDERFAACGGYEDWDLNNRLLKIGQIMIWPDALIRHNAMGTRSKHDNVDAGRRNADLYHSIWGRWEPMV